MNAYLLNCFPNIIDQRTNCCDVCMTDKICGAIVTIAIIAAVTIFLYYIGKLIFNEIREKRQSKTEENNKKFKIKTDYQEIVINYLKDKNTINDDDKFVNKIDEYIDKLS